MATNNILGIANNWNLQPKVTNNFTLTIIPPGGGTGIPGNTNAEKAVEKLQIDLISCSRPDVSFNALTMPRFNQKYSVAGTPNPGILLSTKFRDTIQGNVSRVLWNWSQVIFNPLTGSMGYANSYKCDGEIWVLDPHGKKLEVWKLKGLWPSKLTLGQELAYAETNNVSEISADFTFDIFWIDNSYSETQPATRQTGWEAETKNNQGGPTGATPSSTDVVEILSVPKRTT